jgi:SAM-dependent methyltransferase
LRKIFFYDKNPAQLKNKSRSTGSGDVNLFYRDFYDQVIGTGIVGKAQNRTHKKMERFWSETNFIHRVLEVGAGDGSKHQKFVRHGYSEYVQTDIRIYTPTKNLSPSRNVQTVADAQILPFVDNSFGRVIATCLLLHLQEPELALLEWRRVTEDNGHITILIPTEPGLLLRLSRALLTSPKATRLGFEGYSTFNARDHRNHLPALRNLVKHVYRNDEITENRYPFRIPSWNLNLYFVYQIRIQKSLSAQELNGLQLSEKLS